MSANRLEIKYEVNYQDSKIEPCKQRILVDSSMIDAITHENQIWIDKIRNAPCNLDSTFWIARLKYQPHIALRVCIKVRYHTYADKSPYMNITTDLTCRCKLNGKKIILKDDITPSSTIAPFDKMVQYIARYLPAVLSMTTEEFTDIYGKF